MPFGAEGLGEGKGRWEPHRQAVNSPAFPSIQ